MPWAVLLAQLLGAAAIGVLLASRLGPALLAPHFLIPMACLSMLFVGPLFVRTRKLTASIAAAVGVVSIAISLSLALTGAGYPDTFTIAKAAVSSICCAALAALAAQWLMTKVSKPNHVVWILRGAMIVLYLAYRNFPGFFP